MYLTFIYVNLHENVQIINTYLFAWLLWVEQDDDEAKSSGRMPRKRIFFVGDMPFFLLFRLNQVKNKSETATCVRQEPYNVDTD